MILLSPASPNISNFPIIHSWQEDNGFRAARSRNKAISRSKGKYIILIDGDMILNEYFIADHFCNKERGHFIQGSRAFIKKKKTDFLLSAAFDKSSIPFFSIENKKNSIRSNILSKIFLKKSFDLKGIKTCNMSFFREDFERVNGFNNHIAGWGREDSEFAARLMKSCVKRISLRFNAIQYHLWHKNSPRKSLMKNDQILKNSINSKTIKCESGFKECFDE